LTMGDGWPVVVSGLPAEVGEADAAMAQVVSACGWVHRGWERNAMPGAALGGAGVAMNGPPVVATHGFAEFGTLCGARRCLEAVDGLVLRSGAAPAVLRAAAPQPTRDALAGWADGNPGLSAAVEAAEDEARAVASAGDSLPSLLSVLGENGVQQAARLSAAQVEFDTGTFFDSVFPARGVGGAVAAAALFGEGTVPRADSGPAAGAGDEMDDATLLRAIPTDSSELFAHPVKWDALLLGGDQEAGLNKVAAWAAAKAEKLGMMDAEGHPRPLPPGNAEAVGLLVGERLRERISPQELSQCVGAAFPDLGGAHVDALVASVWRVLVFEAMKAARGALIACI